MGTEAGSCPAFAGCCGTRGTGIDPAGDSGSTTCTGVNGSAITSGSGFRCGSARCTPGASAARADGWAATRGAVRPPDAADAADAGGAGAGAGAGGRGACAGASEVWLAAAPELAIGVVAELAGWVSGAAAIASSGTSARCSTALRRRTEAAGSGAAAGASGCGGPLRRRRAPAAAGAAERARFSRSQRALMRATWSSVRGLT